MQRPLTLYLSSSRWLDILIFPYLDLAIRIYMAKIFFKSGLTRLSDFNNGQWDNQITAFRDYHPVPYVPAELSAGVTTIAELVLPIMLAFGLFTRIGAGGLIIMTMVIQYVVPAEYGLSNPDHFMWILLLAVPFLRGPRHYSIDYWARRTISKAMGKPLYMPK